MDGGTATAINDVVIPGWSLMSMNALFPFVICLLVTSSCWFFKFRRLQITEIQKSCHGKIACGSWKFMEKSWNLRPAVAD